MQLLNFVISFEHHYVKIDICIFHQELINCKYLMPIDALFKVMIWWWQGNSASSDSMKLFLWKIEMKNVLKIIFIKNYLHFFLYFLEVFTNRLWNQKNSLPDNSIKPVIWGGLCILQSFFVEISNGLRSQI